MNKLVVLSVLSAAGACAGRAAPPPPAVPAPLGSTAAATAASVPEPAQSVVPPAPAASAPVTPAIGAPEVAESSRPPRVFPPADITPPYARSAQRGDGHWIPIGRAERGERAAESPPLVVRTLLHPHEASRFITLDIAAVDLDRLRVHYLPGVDDVGDRALDPPPGLVPEADRPSLVAVFNGGFQPAHGHWGMRAGAVTVVPPRKDGCTVAIGSDGSVRIRSWPVIAPAESTLAGYRQTPPCLLEQGAVHPDLLADRDRAWAGHDPKIDTRRRSLVGLDASGRTLFYAVGNEATPRLLAEGMKAAGAADAAELDINWAWTRFLLYGTTKSGEVVVTSTLIDQMVHGRRSYVAKASERDFFYLTRAP